MQPKTTVLPNLWKELVRIGISLVRMYTVYMYMHKYLCMHIGNIANPDVCFILHCYTPHGEIEVT